LRRGQSRFILLVLVLVLVLDFFWMDFEDEDENEEEGFFFAKCFAISTAGNDNLRGGQMLGVPPLGQNRFLTTKF
jgi:hypothetical protein